MEVNQLIRMIDDMGSMNTVEFEQLGKDYVIYLESQGDKAQLFLHTDKKSVIQLPIEGSIDLTHQLKKVNSILMLYNLLRLFKASGFKLLIEFV